MINPYTRENPGNFANNPARAREAGQKGGKMSGGKFSAGSERAKEAGHKGGMTTSKRYLNKAREDNKE